jgi:FkbM family methyltransferase
MGLLKKIRRNVLNIPDGLEKLVALLAHHNVDCVLDIGANQGQYSQSLRRAGYNNTIISFEPLSSMHDLLEPLSKSDVNWHIHERTCVGDEVGEVEINVSNSTDMSSILEIEADTLTALPKSNYVGKEKVAITTVAEVFGTYSSKYKNIFMKVDTQGFEWEVLQGAKKILPQLTGIQLELSLFSLYENEKTFEEITAWLKDQGFDPILVIPGYFSKKLMKQLQIDIIFIRKDLLEN